MGREIRRVALDFDHPLNVVWPGFIRQGREFPPCPDCQHGHIETLMDRLFPSGSDSRPTGLSREAFAIDNTFYAHQVGGPLADALSWHDKLGQAEVDMLVAERRIGSHTHWDRVELPEPWEMDTGHPIRYRFERNDKSAPSPAEVNAANGAAGGLFHNFGHDGINRMLLVRHRCEVLGITVECATCKGHCDLASEGERAAEEAAEEAWQQTEPPAGEGWQLWETVSEGSPISPVFDSAEGLATWMTENDCTVNGPVRSFAAAMKFIDAGWAPSFISTPETGFNDGVTHAGLGAE